MILGLLGGWQRPAAGLGWRHGVLLGLALGAVAAGVAALAKSLAPSLAPTWPDYAPAGTYLPILSVALSPILRFIRMATLFLLLFSAMDRFSNGWNKRRLLLSILVMATVRCPTTY